MHLLSATPGSISNGDEAIDLNQSPGDIVILTVADSELACFAKAAKLLPAGSPSIRLANLLQLIHPYSVDLYLEKVIAKARFVCVVLLGGKSYWSYGVDEIAELARQNKIAFAAIAEGTDNDPALDGASTVSAEVREKLRSYLRQGGITNALGFLRTAAQTIGVDAGLANDPVPVADAGLYLIGVDRPTFSQVKASWVEQTALESSPSTDPRPIALLIFYRALMIAGTLDAVDIMVQSLQARGFRVVAAYVRALREPFAIDWLSATLGTIQPDVILNCTSFAASSSSEPRKPSVLEQANCPILQVAFSGMTEGDWQDASRGLGIRDLAMNVALPEVDGRIFTRAVTFKASENFDETTECSIVVPKIVPNRMNFVVDLAANWARLRTTASADRRIALVMANYPNQDGRIGNGVGLDTPASVTAILQALGDAGYDIGAAPQSSADLMALMTRGVTNNLLSIQSTPQATVSLAAYQNYYAQIPAEARNTIEARWGDPEADPFVKSGKFFLPIQKFGNIVVSIQPARGYNINPKETYHDPALPPPHAYLAYHFWLRHEFDAQAFVHVGKHGNLEWLPGKAVSLSETCFPEICAGPLPQLYPFIVNDPGEGTQAKRRIGALILDHLTPPLTRAESYGPLKQLEALVDEYYLAAGMDPRRLSQLRSDILDLARLHGLDKDANAKGDNDEALSTIDNYLCELKELQIRDGLHVFTQSPEGRLRRDLLMALVRTPRGYDHPGQASLLRAIVQDLDLSFDPLDCRMADNWEGPRPECLTQQSADLWRSVGDTVERLEEFALTLIENDPTSRIVPGPNTAAVLKEISENLAVRVDACGRCELQALLDGLNGKFVLPGPSGAPTRGRPDVLPTGRNFYSVDTRAVPTQVAWGLGQKSAELLVSDYLQREGGYPRAIALSAWGTANMRTGGDDIAQALALMGVRPRWDFSSGRVIGFEVITLAELGRPRVDVTLRVSGFFRDAFPEQMALIDSATRAILSLEESDQDNPALARYRTETHALVETGTTLEIAERLAGTRVFGSKPGAYGAGLQAMIDERLWHKRSDLANGYLNWGGYAYGAGMEGQEERSLFAERLSTIDAIIQNQDNREHDLLDSDDYYQFEGGIAAAIEHLKGSSPVSYHNDHSRPERPVIRTLADELGRIVRGRVTNPKWIAGVMRHGYKGAFEIAASVDYLFAFAATTNAVQDHHFDAVYAAFIEDDVVREFMATANPSALQETAKRLAEAQERGLWKSKSNSAGVILAQLITPTNSPIHAETI